MLKKTIKSTIKTFSDLSATNIMIELEKRFDDFEILNLEVQRINEFYSPYFEYTITFNSSILIDI